MTVGLTPVDGKRGCKTYGKRLATTVRHDDSAKVWDAATGKELRKELLTWKDHADIVLSMAWSPDWERLATGNYGGTATVWDADTGTELLTLKGHEETVRSVVWSPDGNRLATGSDDKTAKVWDAVSGTELLTLKGHEDTVRSVAWSRDGERGWRREVTTRRRRCGTQVRDDSSPDTARTVRPADAEKLRLLVESARIRLAYAHDRQFAVSLSGIRTLPHQIEAVDMKMLPQPRLRFLLADDPGAGKTIMAGLLLKEMKLREAIERVLILCPAPLTIQW